MQYLIDWVSSIRVVCGVTQYKPNKLTLYEIVNDKYIV
jgi:hypothetical protein